MRGHDRINLILPDEIILEIFRHLDSKSTRDACSLVCKRWLHLERLSRDTIRIGASGTPNVLVKLLSSRFVNVTSVYIDERLSISLPLDFGRRRVANQSALSWLWLHFVSERSESGDNETDSYCLSDAGLAAVADGFTKLDKLSLIWCSNATSAGLRSVAERCRSLKSLDLQGRIWPWVWNTCKSVEGSDSWVDDPITRHIISLHISKGEEGENHLLWPFILHSKGHYSILVLPLVEPRHLKAYAKMCRRSDCGDSVGVDGSLSSLLLDLPCITGAFMVAHALGDIITGDVSEPEVVVNASPSVGGLLDSLTGSIGISSISARAKPMAALVAASTTSSTAVSGAVTSDAPKIGSRMPDKDILRSFISSAMPFGTPLDLSLSNFFATKNNGFSSADLPPADRKQPAWKPYLYKGRQRILFTIHETVNAAMYDRDEIPDSISISGQVNCRAELEGLPDVLFPLAGLDAARAEVLSFHPCAQVPEKGGDKQAVMFSPPLGNFVLLHYQALCGTGPPVKGFYQLSMVSENEGAFLFRLSVMEGYKAPLMMEFCTVTMPFPRRRVVSFEGTPSIGTVSHTDHSVEWKIIAIGRGAGAKSIEAMFTGTVKFTPWHTQRLTSLGSGRGVIPDEDTDTETESTNNMVNVEDS